MYGYGRGFFGLPPVVKNIILLNVILLFADFTVSRIYGVNLSTIFGLYFPQSERFMPLQLVTHMFMHGGLLHLLFNMYALFIFGQVLEQVWGSKRFFIYYMVCGLGAAAIHETVIFFQCEKAISAISPDQLAIVLNEGAAYFKEGRVFTDESMRSLQRILNTPTVGASGAVFGILLAFGVLFPNTQLMLLFPPIPMRAKYFVMIFGAIELYLAITKPGSHIAHAAHLGGMLFGYILIRYWRSTTDTLY